VDPRRPWSGWDVPASAAVGGDRGVRLRAFAVPWHQRPYSRRRDGYGCGARTALSRSKRSRSETRRRSASPRAVQLLPRRRALGHGRASLAVGVRRLLAWSLRRRGDVGRLSARGRRWNGGLQARSLRTACPESRAGAFRRDRRRALRARVGPRCAMARACRSCRIATARVRGALVCWRWTQATQGGRCRTSRALSSMNAGLRGSRRRGGSVLRVARRRRHGGVPRRVLHPSTSAARRSEPTLELDGFRADRPRRRPVRGRPLGRDALRRERRGPVPFDVVSFAPRACLGFPRSR